jgi:hypothetical protein
MEMEAVGIVTDPSTINATDGNSYTQLLGRQREQLGADLHGKYYTQALRGALFHGTITTASAIPVTNTTTPTMALWNPSNSGKLAVLVRYAAGWAATTEAPGNIQLAWFQSGAAQIATGSLITAFTAATPHNGTLGLGKAPAMKFGSGATVTAATQFIPLGLSHLTTTGTATFGSFTYIVDFDGMIVIPPGVFVFDVASTATASTYNRTLTWYEVPVL